MCVYRRVMREGKIERVKRQLLRAAVDEKLDTIRGLPPRPLRPVPRFGRLWLRRLSLVVIPLTLAGSTYIVTNTTASAAVPPPRRLAFALPLPPRSAFRRISGTAT